MIRTTEDINRGMTVLNPRDEIMKVLHGLNDEFFEDAWWIANHVMFATGIKWRHVQINVELKLLLATCKKLHLDQGDITDVQGKLKNLTTDLMVLRRKLTEKKAKFEKLTEDITELLGPADSIVEDMCTLLAELTGRSERKWQHKILDKARRVDRLPLPYF